MRLLNKIIIITFFLAVSIALTVSFLVYGITNEEFQNSISKNEIDLTSHAMDKIDHLLYERVLDIQTVARENIFNHVLSTNGQISREHREDDIKLLPSKMSEFAVGLGTWQLFSLIDLDGVVIASSHREGVGEKIDEDPFNYEAYKKALNGEIYISDVVISEEIDMPTMVFSAPVIQKDKRNRPVIGVLIGHFAWQAVLDSLENIKNSSTFLYNSNGDLIGAGNRIYWNKILKENFKSRDFVIQSRTNEQGAFVSSGIFNESEVLISYSKQFGHLGFKGKEWILVFETPLEDVFLSAQNTSFKITFLVVLIIVIYAAILVIFFSKIIVYPISSLTKTTKEITSSGNLERKVSIKGSSELEDLSDNFNIMIDSLQKERENIEKKVSQRTLELQRLNKHLVGRELKMVEMKKEIQKLKNK